MQLCSCLKNILQHKVVQKTVSSRECKQDGKEKPPKLGYHRIVYLPDMDSLRLNGLL